MKNKSDKKKVSKGSVVCAVIAILLVIVTVATHLPLTYPAICIVLGGQRPILAEGSELIYAPDYDSKEAALEAANELNTKIVEEGIVLLKNENDALPIHTPESSSQISENPKISVFGQNSINLALGGSGSGAASNDATAITDLYEALEMAGYDVNPTLKEFYENSGYKRSQNSGDLDSGDTVFLSTGEVPQSAYTDAVKQSYSTYSDAALVVFTRIGGEGFDLPRTMKGQEGARSESDHYLQLDQNEADLLKAVCEAGFKKVIVVINSGAAMELGFLEAKTGYVDAKGYEIDPAKIDAALWIGFPGDSGMEAFGKILNGTVSPSGKTVDTYVADLTKDPSWFNFGDNRVAGGDMYTDNGADTLYYFVDYEESVYVGYRYYETRGVSDGEEWYQKSVVYPFGYGLSYTTFEWTVVDQSAVENQMIDGATQYTVTVKVTNTGSVAGKDVVQLYGHAPYIPGEIEKPEVILLDFAKTELLEPGESQEVTLTFDPYYLASYDYNDANGNSNKGYELDASDDYALYVSANAHEIRFEIPFCVAEDILYTEDPVTGTTVQNLYTDNADLFVDADLGLETLLTRTDWEGSMPQTPTAEERAMSAELKAALMDLNHNNPNAAAYAEEELPWFGDPVTVTLRDLLTNQETGEYGHADYDDERWETLISECTEDELIELVNQGAFKSVGIESIGKPLTNDTDGPAGFTNFMSEDGTYWGTCHYCAEVNMASTWNLELIEDLGEMVGNEGLQGAAGRGNGLPYSGWYAPGANIHRSAFGGRNFEYFSEDSILSGKMAAAEIRGCQSKGVYCFMKHFALNDQETHRSRTGLITWASEQTMREIYLKPFEIAVKDGGTSGIMSSFNRIGTRWAGGDYRLLTTILRDEWGFRGMVICDFNTIPSYMNSKQMAYAGGDLNLATQPVTWCDTSDVADLIVLRNCAKNILYTVANSNAMNGDIVGYAMPIWEIALYAIDCIAAVGIAVWGIFVVVKKKKPQQ